jgi:hypothetical protein
VTWHREDETHLALEGGDLVVRRYQDAQDIADRAKMLREQPNRGDFHHRWSLPNTLVDAFYQEYCGNVPGNPAANVRPMNQEFWEWVHKKMKDPQYRMFWCHDPQSQFRVGYEHAGK